MNFKKNFWSAIYIPAILLSVIFGVPASLVLWYDYLQIFPKGYFIEEKYQTDMREQAKGIIDNIDFTSVILGTSLLRASSAHELNTLCGNNNVFINLSMSSGNFYERSILLDYILKKRKIKNIVYSFEDFSYYGQEDYKTIGFKWIPLYDEDKNNDILRYVDLNLVKKTIKKIFKFHTNTHADISFFEIQKTLEHSNAYGKKYGGLQNIIKNINDNARYSFIQRVCKAKDCSRAGIPLIPELEEQDKNKYFKYIDKNIIAHIASNHNTVFHIILPPVSRYYFAEMRQTQVEKYALYKEVNAYIVKMSAKYPNLRVYGFEDMAFLDDISNYADTLHYNPSINSMMNHAIAEGTHILTPENIDAYLEQCDHLAQDFNIQKFYEEVKRIMVECGFDPNTGEK